MPSDKESSEGCSDWKLVDAEANERWAKAVKQGWMTWGEEKRGRIRRKFVIVPQKGKENDSHA